jgi:hypothetical protein
MPASPGASCSTKRRGSDEDNEFVDCGQDETQTIVTKRSSRNDCHKTIVIPSEARDLGCCFGGRWCRLRQKPRSLALLGMTFITLKHRFYIAFLSLFLSPPIAKSREGAKTLNAFYASPPPSTTNAAPVIQLAIGLARNKTALATSSGAPTRPSGRLAASRMNVCTSSPS